MAEVLEGKELLDYVNARRNELSKKRAFAAGDEVDFLEAFKAGRLRESTYSLPSKEEAAESNVTITRNIFNLEAGVNEAVGQKYGSVILIPYDQY